MGYTETSEIVIGESLTAVFNTSIHVLSVSLIQQTGRRHLTQGGALGVSVNFTAVALTAAASVSLSNPNLSDMKDQFPGLESVTVVDVSTYIQPPPSPKKKINWVHLEPIISIYSIGVLAVLVFINYIWTREYTIVDYYLVLKTS
jgi:hypothetical protein